MPGILLRPWDLDESEKVELYWLGAPFRNTNGQWQIRALFRKTDNRFCMEYFPWGMLPALNIGRKYQAGIPLNEAVGIKGKVTFPTDPVFDICDGFSIPQSFRSFKKNPAFGRQKVCHFRVYNKNYFLPCVEVVRGVLAPYNVLLNRIFETDGLNSLIESYTIERTFSEIRFSEEFPRALLNDMTVAFILWLISDRKANKSWDSVYKNIYYEASNSPGGLEAGLETGVTVVVKPPISSDEVWYYRGFEENNNVLILEICGRKNLRLPFTMVNYVSPKFNRAENVNEPREISNSEESEGVVPYVSQDESDNPSGRHREPLLAGVLVPSFSFLRMPVMNKIREVIRKKKTGEKVEGTGTAKGKDPLEQTGSVRDWARGGVVRSIEFLPLADYPEMPPGLEDFLRMTSCLLRMRPGWSISLRIVSVGKKRRYSKADRLCAIVRVSCTQVGTVYLVEASRKDDLSISTLVLKPNPEVENHRKILVKNLQIISDRYYHWNTKLLNKQNDFRFCRVRHPREQKTEDWAERVIERICL